jgi:uncharacterized membrane protein
MGKEFEANVGVTEIRRDPLRRWIRIVRTRPRLFLAMLLGFAIAAFSPADWRLSTRALVGWDIAIGLYLALAFRLMTNCDVNRIRRRAAHQDEGRITILVLVVASALASLLAILAELGGGNRQSAHLALAAVTILLSWAFTHTIFAIHYAHEYYSDIAPKAGGLNFPGEETPDYWDFVYFSFVVGMTSQVSDVAVTSRPLRRLVAAHGAVSFIFNATLLALTVNMAAGAI